MRQSSSPGFPHPTALHPAPFPNKISCFVSTCLLGQFLLSVRQEPTLGALTRSLPLPTTLSRGSFPSGSSTAPSFGGLKAFTSAVSSIWTAVSPDLDQGAPLLPGLCTNIPFLEVTILLCMHIFLLPQPPYSSPWHSLFTKSTDLFYFFFLNSCPWWLRW